MKKHPNFSSQTEFQFAMAKLLFLALLLIVLSARSAGAQSIQYTESFTASGSLGGTTFTDASITLTAFANASDVTGSGTESVINQSLELNITGFTLATVTGPTDTFVNTQTEIAGISGPSGNQTLDIFDVYNPAFATYDLKSAIGPLSGANSINGGYAFATSDGSFILEATRVYTTGSGTFLASVAGAPSDAAPEPSTLLLMVTGLALLRFCSRRGWLRCLRCG